MKALVIYILATALISANNKATEYTYDYQDYDADYAGITESNNENYPDRSDKGEL